MTTTPNPPVTTKKPLLIGLVSHAPQSGKSTIADILVDHHWFVREPFAGPIREFCIEILIGIGISPGDADHYTRNAKETVIPELGITARRLMQTLGTDWGRRRVHPNLWLMHWQNTYKIYANSRSQSFGVRSTQAEHDAQEQQEPLCIVVDDVRFPNEAELIRSLGGQLWEVVRPGTPTYYPLPVWLSCWIPKRWRSRFHPSEGRLKNYPHFDIRIVNDGSLEDLEAVVSTLVSPVVRLILDDLKKLPGWEVQVLPTQGASEDVQITRQDLELTLMARHGYDFWYRLLPKKAIAGTP